VDGDFRGETEKKMRSPRRKNAKGTEEGWEEEEMRGNVVE
jgi:hypothetical protein